MKPDVVRQLADAAWMKWWGDKCPGDWTTFMVNYILDYDRKHRNARAQRRYDNRINSDVEF